MGSSAWSDDAYKHLKTDYSTKSTAQIFTSKTLDNEMSPKDVKFRESRDSDAHPNSLAIGVFLDVTGSMGSIPERLVREKLGALMTTLITHGIPDAHVLFGGIGDHYSDSTPLQVGQFEAGTDELNKWLTKIYLEGGGGGQTMESYSLAWLFSGRHTSIDCFEKRGEKGFLFTIGDEYIHNKLEKSFLKELLGYKFGEDITAEQLLSEAQRMYHVFHLHIHETSTGKTKSVIDGWKKLLGERVIMVEDYNNVAEIIASTVAVVCGADLKNVVAGLFRVNIKKFCGINELKISSVKAIEYFNNGKQRIRIVKESVWLIEDFFFFQYGSTFNPDNRVHKSIEHAYNQLNIKMTSIRGLLDLKEGVKDKDKDIKKGGTGENKNGQQKKGVRFDENYTGVFFEDGSFQKLGEDQKESLKNGTLKPYFIIKGSKY